MQGAKLGTLAKLASCQHGDVTFQCLSSPLIRNEKKILTVKCYLDRSSQLPVITNISDRAG